jgi:hypothetical protein
MTRLLPVALAGCLFLSEPPPGADPSPDCVDTGCAEGFSCDTFLDACATTCDSIQLCQSGFSCDDGTCVEDCDESDCDDNLGCDTIRNECYSDCDTNDECASGFTCCTSTRRNNGRCDVVGTCF